MERLRRTRPSLKGIALSGFGNEDDIQHALASGFARHLLKPIDIDCVQRALIEVAAESRAQVGLGS